MTRHRAMRHVRHNRRRRDDAGFGLIEAVVALLLLAIAVVPITHIVITTLNASNYLHLRGEATDLATQALETAQYQAANGSPPNGIPVPPTPETSGNDRFMVGVVSSLVAGTSASANLCTAGSGNLTSQIWSVTATVTWGVGPQSGHVTEATLVSPTSADLANSNAAEIAVPVYEADDATRETAQPIDITVTGSCSLGLGKCGAVPPGQTTTPPTGSTGFIGCAVFADLYAGAGETYTITVSGNSGYVDPNESFYLSTTPSVQLPTTVLVQPNNVTVADNPNLILAPGAPTAVNFQTQSYSGGSSSSPSPASVTLASSTNPSTTGTQVTFTATVSPPAATGTLTLTDNGSGSPLTCSSFTSGTETCTETYASAGIHVITASYGGDASHGPGSASLTQVVAVPPTPPTPATVTLASSVNPSMTGTQVTFTATVSPPSATGTLALTDNGSGSPLTCSSFTSGTETCTETYASAGSHVITASYGGDASHGPGSASLTQVVLSSSIAPAPYLPISVQSPTLICSTLGAGICVLGNGTSAGGFNSQSAQTALLFPGPSTSPNYSAWAGDQIDSEPFYQGIYGNLAASAFTATAGVPGSIVLPVYPLSLDVSYKADSLPPLTTGLTVKDAGGGDPIGLNPVTSSTANPPSTSATGLPLGQFQIQGVGTGTETVSPAYVWILPTGVCASPAVMTSPCSNPSTSPIPVTVG